MHHLPHTWPRCLLANATVTHRNLPPSFTHHRFDPICHNASPDMKTLYARTVQQLFPPGSDVYQRGGKYDEWICMARRGSTEVRTIRHSRLLVIPHFHFSVTCTYTELLISLRFRIAMDLRPGLLPLACEGFCPMRLWTPTGSASYVSSSSATTRPNAY